MPLGPVELLVIAFPGNEFKGEIAPALAELVENGTIRVLDVIFARKESNGDLTVLEITDLDDDAFGQFEPVVGNEVSGLLSQEDVEMFAKQLDNNTSVAALLYENTWATRFRDAVLNANGKLVVHERIPRTVVEELTAA